MVVAEYRALVSNLYANGYSRIPYAESRESLEAAVKSYVGVLDMIDSDERLRFSAQMNPNPREFIGFRDVELRRRKNSIFFHYVRGIESRFRDERFRDFFEKAHTVYSHSVDSLKDLLGLLGTKFGDLSPKFFSQDLDERLFLRFILFPKGQESHFAAHYDHAAVTLGIHQSQPGLNIGVTDDSASFVEYEDGKAIVYFGREFERISKDVPLARHFVDFEGKTDYRVSIVLIANVLDGLKRRATPEEKSDNQRIRTYSPEGLKRLLIF